jgi:monooxygenase
MKAQHFDVLIIGAGLSGISAGYHLQKHCPGKTYGILEARERLGGTWDLFKYPGIRSDSDMYTLGFPFRPWLSDKAIADGGSILAYIKDTAQHFGIDRHIHYGQRLQRASFASDTARWTVHTDKGAFTCSFLLSCTGYYDYEHGYTPEFVDREKFRGTILHPQHWPEDFDATGKRIVVIGSGATAVTLVPSLAKKAAHVTMLQRSPTYVVSLPEKDRFANAAKAVLPVQVAHSATRWKNVLLNIARYEFCRARPEDAKRFIVRGVKKELGKGYDVRKHFVPSYNPWDQRVCLVPDGDMFHAIREGRASVVTEHIERFTEHGIRLKSGQELQADVIITATGLNLKFFGGAELVVDDKTLNPHDRFVYLGTMLSDVPNFALSVGYTNASWTLKCVLSHEYVCRVLNHMDKHGKRIVCPRADANVEEESLLALNSGYVLRSLDKLPRQGTRAPWRLKQNYVADLRMLRNAKLEDGVLQMR